MSAARSHGTGRGGEPGAAVSGKGSGAGGGQGVSWGWVGAEGTGR